MQVLYKGGALFDGENAPVSGHGVMVEDDKVVRVAPETEYDGFEGQTVDTAGGTLMPGLIDCHTHLVFGGNRIREYEMRLEGASYEEIARQGGGIRSTVKATRAASEDELHESAKGRLQNLMAEGVTTVEIKSGYGLDVGNELKMLRVARRLGEELPVRVVTSFLGAHALRQRLRRLEARHPALGLAQLAEPGEHRLHPWLGADVSLDLPDRLEGEVAVYGEVLKLGAPRARP